MNGRGEDDNIVIYIIYFSAGSILVMASSSENMNKIGYQKIDLLYCFGGKLYSIAKYV